MIDILVHHAELSVQGGRQVYVMTVETVRDDQPEGRLNDVGVHLMETETFESRAAEYGVDLDADDAWDQLFDLVLGGSQVNEDVNDQLADPDHLWNAPTIAHARKERLRRIHKVRGGGALRGVPGKSRNRVISNTAIGLENSEEEDPLEFIRRTAPMSPEHIKIKQEFTRRRRNLIRARRAGRHPLRLTDMSEVDDQVRRDMRLRTPRESAEELAQRLLGDVPEHWADGGAQDQRRAAVYRDENDIPRDRLPPREGAPSKYL